MTHTTRMRGNGLSRVLRPIVLGFLVGFFVTVPATLLALMFSWAERASDFIVPSTYLLRPLSPFMANWHGGLSMGLVSIVNGVVYALAVAVIALVWFARRR